jgi:Spy/CpxP family protein refolding chaperone
LLLLALVAAAPAVLALAPARAAAQEDDEPDGPPPGPERERMMERVRLLRMYVLTEALELDEATASKLFPYLRQTDEELRALQDQKREQRRAMQEMLRAEQYETKEVDRRIAALMDIESKIAAAQGKQVQGLKGIVSDEQRLKFVMVRGRFERQVREMLREERERRNRGGEPPPPGGGPSGGAPPPR